jgi:N-terminal C2 in EEIG1 and EHBP1 proteins
MYSAKTANWPTQSSRNTLKSRTHLIGHLLPRHANFHARIQIHQISSVPFVSGEFGVRWKFKGVQSSSARKKGLLGRVKAKAEINDKGKGRELDASLVSHTTMVPDSTLSELPDPLTVPICSTLRRGTTPFLKLKDHSVVWSHTLDTLLKFDIDRETSQIHPNPLKLVVMQRIIPDDPDGSPQNPRLGAVYLNLAEYVGKGSVERKYLLKESKTNSVLKVSCCFSRLKPY